MKKLGGTPLKDGLSTISSFDFGVKYCGWCKASVRKDSGEVEILRFSSGIVEVVGLEGNSKKDLLKIFSGLNHRLTQEVGLCNKYLIEIPGQAIYGIHRASKPELMRRANGVRDLQSAIFSYVERTSSEYSNDNVERNFFYNRFIMIEPSQWQDKSEIKKFKDSKDWSIKTANSLEYVEKKIKISHEADAIVMFDRMVMQ